MNNRELLKVKADTLRESDIAEILEYISIMESLGGRGSRFEGNYELIPRAFSEAMKAVPTIARRIDHERNSRKH